MVSQELHFYKGEVMPPSPHLFDNFRQMNKVLDAIKSEKTEVNIGGKIIKLVWKNKVN